MELLDSADAIAKDAFCSSLCPPQVIFRAPFIDGPYEKLPITKDQLCARHFYIYDIKDKNQQSKEIDFIQAIVVGRVPQIWKLECVSTE